MVELYAQKCIMRKIHRCLSTAQPPALSKRKLFQSIEPDKKIVSHLDNLRLGFVPKRRARVALAKKFGNLVGEPTTRYDSGADPTVISETPYPFKKVGILLDTAKSAETIPEVYPGEPPEVAVIGRSNVGKSSLLNALIGFNTSFVQKASVSERPGHTQHLQFFGLGSTLVDSTDPNNKRKKGPSLVVVDMPGYGFAYMSEAKMQQCQALCTDYLLHRQTLKRVLLLLDGRHGFKVGDKDFFKNLIFGGEPNSEKTARSLRLPWKLQIVLTKCDLVDRIELARRIKLVRNQVSEALPGFGNQLQVIPLSSEQRRGIVDLQKELSALVKPKPARPIIEPAEATQSVVTAVGGMSTNSKLVSGSFNSVSGSLKASKSVSGSSNASESISGSSTVQKSIANEGKRSWLNKRENNTNSEGNFGRSSRQSRPGFTSREERAVSGSRVGKTSPRRPIPQPK